MLIFKPIHVLFSFGDLKVYIWGLIAAIAFLFSTYLASKYAKKKGEDPENIWGIAVYAIIGGLIGSRLLYVLLNLSSFTNFWDIFKIWEGGIVSYGGILGALSLVYFYIKKKKLNFWKYADTLAPYVALGFAIARIGCFLNWDDFGIGSNLPWAVKVGSDIARHPTQLYLMFANLITFLFLLRVRKFKKFDGQIFLLFLIVYSVFRFLIAFLREHSGLVKILSFIVPILIIIVSLVLLKKFKNLK